MKHQGKHDISEVYSPRRVMAMAQRMWLKGGWTLDLVEVDPGDGQPLDFSTPDKRAKALKKVRDDKPFMLITSPMCGPFSGLQSLFNYPKQDHKSK